MYFKTEDLRSTDTRMNYELIISRYSASIEYNSVLLTSKYILSSITFCMTKNKSFGL